MGMTADQARQYRIDHPEYRAANNRRTKAQNRALRELGKKYPKEFTELFNKHMRLIVEEERRAKNDKT